MSQSPVIDADHHYYEALDAFTRHLDPKLGPRVIEWVDVGGRKYHSVGGRVYRGVANPTFDPVAEPGVLASYFRGNPDGVDPVDMLRARERIRPEYRDRSARIERIDAQGLDSVLLFPTLAMLYEEALRDDPEAVTLLFTSFNRWLDEDWGFARDSRITAAPYISLCDVDWACAELDRSLAQGAKMVVMRPAAPVTAAGPISPASPVFDPFWARINEAGIAVVVHAGDSGYTAHGYARDGFTTDFAGIPQPIRMLQLERPIEDFLASLVCDRLFDRFPRVRVASVENGSRFLGGLFDRLRIVSHKMVGWFSEDPVETLRRHVWVNPFWEDDVRELVSLVGAQRVVFGSDWPHIEGLSEPLEYRVELDGFDDASRAAIMGGNAATLLTPGEF
ncbi:MAG: amidohydrolase family protein [Actinobacteria bacterium]|nr:amidohydrolase family protein [Actinomycetota bacterium]